MNGVSVHVSDFAICANCSSSLLNISSIEETAYGTDFSTAKGCFIFYVSPCGNVDVRY